MLIQSTKHTSQDLNKWAEYELADMVVAAKVSQCEHVRKAMDAISDFARKGQCYVGTSWGKDSVILLHMLMRSGCKIPVINLRVEPTRNPYCDVVRDFFLSRFPCDYHEISVSYHGCGDWFSEAWDKETYGRWNAAWKEANRRFGHRHISGVRAKESGIRNIRMRVHGLSSENTSAPLGWLPTEWVFAYMAHYDLPIHPNYAMLGGGRYDREKIRVSEIGDQGGVIRGRREWEMEYYGDIMRRIRASK